MASPLKCPAPNCPFLFDPDQVPPGAVIACPRCGLRFTLGPTAPAYPGYGMPPPPPEPEPQSSFREDLFTSVEGSAEKPRAKGIGGEPTAHAKIRPRSHGKYGSLKSILVATGIVSGIGAVGLLLVFLTLYKKSQRPSEETDTELKYPELNLRFKKPASDSGWARHDETLTSFNASLFGYGKGDDANPSASIVGDARRFDHAVRPGDLKERITELLDRHFDNVTESEDPRDDTLCGLPATRFQYRATHKKTGDAITLEVHALANKAIGVWVFAWAAEREFAGYASAFQSLRAGLQIAKAGDVSSEVPTSTKTHRSRSGIFTLKEQDGLWTKQEPATSRDANGTLWLRGTPKSAGGKNKPGTADIVVVEIEPVGDAKDQALDTAKQSLAEGESIIEEIAGEPTGDPAIGELVPATPVTRLKVRYKGADSGVNKLVVFASVDSGSKRVVAYATCPLKDLPYWEQRLMQVVGSLTARSK